MTDEQLNEIEARAKAAEFSDDWSSMVEVDVPALVAEVRRLRERIWKHEEWLKSDSQYAENQRLKERIAELEKQLADNTERRQTLVERLEAACIELEFAGDKIRELAAESDDLKKAMGSRGRADCPKCKGAGAYSRHDGGITHDTDSAAERGDHWTKVRCGCRVKERS